VSDGSDIPDRAMMAPQLERALEISGAATWEWDIAADAMRYSPNLPRVWGLDPAEFARAGFLALSRYLHPDDRRAYLIAHRELRAGKRMDIVYRGRNDRGVYRWYREVGQSGDGSLRIGTVVDVTALKSAEANLALALDVAELGWWSVDLEARRHTWSARTRAIWGVAPDAKARYRTWYQRVHPDDRDTLVDLMSFPGTRGTQIYRIVHEDGAIRHVREEFRVERDAMGQATRLFATVQDMTEVERARLAAEAANRAKSEFLAMISHELRTPLNGVIGTLDLIEESPLNPQQSRWAQIARVSAESLIAIVDDLLDLAKLESGKLGLSRSNFDPRVTVAAAVESQRARAQTRGLSLEFERGDDLPPRVSGDGGRVRQIVVNLIGNAIKFTDRGGVSVSLDGAREADGRWRLSVAIVDTGIGMDETTLANLFSPFYQADTSSTRKRGGTGLGLAICKRLSEAMDGGISAESAPGKGSVFRFWLRVPEV
jgi:signal transduction histidine kinase